MDKNLINISSIETWFDSILTNKLSSHVFFGSSLPNAIKSSWQDMVLVDCGNAVKDNNAYGFGSVLVYLYAKPLSSGSKNVPVLNRLEKKLNEIIKSSKSDNYVISRRQSFSDYDTQNKMHFNVVVLNLTIL